jgi:hypothetical protein
MDADRLQHAEPFEFRSHERNDHREPRFVIFPCELPLGAEAVQLVGSFDGTWHSLVVPPVAPETLGHVFDPVMLVDFQDGLRFLTRGGDPPGTL